MVKILSVHCGLYKQTICLRVPRYPLPPSIHHHLSISDLIRIFCSAVRPILEYGCQVWHFSLTEKLSNQMERIQRRVTKSILSDQISYNLRLEKLKLTTLAERREELCRKLFQSITQNKNDKLDGLLPQPKEHAYSMRNPREFPMFKAKTDRFVNSFICQSVKKNLIISLKCTLLCTITITFIP